MSITLVILFILPLGHCTIIASSAPSHKHPYLVEIRNWNDELRGNQEYFQCTGTIITDTWILTAGQCLQNSEISDIKVLVSGSEPILPSTKDSRDHLDVIKLEIHPDMYRYRQKHRSNFRQYANDLGLLKLAKPVGNDFIRPLDCIHPILDGKDTVLFGYGWVHPDNFGARPLIHVLHSTVIDCNPNLFKKICTTSQFNTAHDGDVGAPLFYNGKQLGVLTSIDPNGLPEHDIPPNEFVKLCFWDYKSWVEKTIKT